MSNEDSSQLRLDVCADINYEKLVVNICSNEFRVLTLNCDNGLENTRIEIYNDQNEMIWNVPYHDFIKYFKEAFSILKEE